MLPPPGDGPTGIDGNLPQVDLSPVVTDGPPLSHDLSGDQGPVITFLLPTAPTAHGTVMVDITITDANSPPDPTTVKVGIKAFGDVTMTQIGSNPLRFTGTVDFNKFTPPLTGSVLIKATAASQGGVVGNASVSVLVDNSGPDIVFVNPTAGQFVGGVVTLKIDITDESLVDDTSVSAVVGGSGGSMSIALQRTAPGMPEFSAPFDFHALGAAYVFPTLSVHAEDTFHNATDVSEEIVIDNVPPIAALDPPPLRVGKLSSGVWQCSHLFDPVGSDSANDGFAYPQIITTRARIEDRGNSAPGLAFERWSDVNPTQVSLLVLPSATSSGQLLVDTDGDGNCDDINPLLLPVSSIAGANEVLQLQMVSMALGGSADFENDPSGVVVAGVCDTFSDGSTTPPVELCAAANTPMTFSLPYAAVAEPAIWTLPPVTSGPAGCTGLQFDSRNVPEGPACVAVRAIDNAGNTGISPPLRICICHGAAASCAACTGWPTGGAPFSPLANCGGVYDKLTKTVAAGSVCTPPPSKFGGPGEVRHLGN
ncbi:MAG TPA: hypothetical protein VFF06_08080 [Polyangia bacterium]|nr:hypothetical protein [Polyangia bacterium]